MSFAGKQHSTRTRRLISQRKRGRRPTNQTRARQSLGHTYSLVAHARGIATRSAGRHE